MRCFTCRSSSLSFYKENAVLPKPLTQTKDENTKQQQVCNIL